MRRGLVICLVALSAVRAAYGQSSAAPLISAARTALEAPNPDAAAVLLERALEPGLGATPAEQTRAWVLYGIAELMRDNAVAARRAFRQALQRDGSLRIDSLYFFHDDVEREFAAEREAAAPAPAGAAPALAVMVRVPSDTILPPGEGRWPIGTRPTFRARVVYTVTPVDSQSTIVWSDTQAVGSTGTTWDLRSSSGTPIHPGRYALRVTASDSLGQVAPTVERVLDVARLPYDSTRLPPPLPPSAFAPDSARVHPGSVLWLLGGLAVSTALIETRSGSPWEHAQWPDIATFGATAVGLLVFVAGRHTAVYSENTVRNRKVREEDAQRRVSLAQANERARDAAPLRVRVEGVVR